MLFLLVSSLFAEVTQKMYVCRYDLAKSRKFCQPNSSCIRASLRSFGILGGLLGRHALCHSPLLLAAATFAMPGSAIRPSLINFSALLLLLRDQMLLGFLGATLHVCRSSSIRLSLLSIHPY